VNIFKKKYHWYNFSYAYSCGFGSAQTGYKYKYITNKAINENRIYAKVGEDSVLLSVSYLGYMTREQYEKTN